MLDQFYIWKGKIIPVDVINWTNPEFQNTPITGPFWKYEDAVESLENGKSKENSLPLITPEKVSEIMTDHFVNVSNEEFSKNLVGFCSTSINCGIIE